MKRIISVLAIAALMAVMLVAMAMPAFADAKPQANDNNCQGNTVSHLTPEQNPGLFVTAGFFDNAGDLNKHIQEFCQSL